MARKPTSLDVTSPQPLSYVVDPDNVPSSKVLNYNYSVGSSEVVHFFGELQVYGNLAVHGEVTVQRGNPLQENLPSTVSYDTTLYGPVVVSSEVNVNASVTVL